LARTFLEQAINNLVDNALRYLGDGGHVAIVLETTGDRFTLRVLDDGPGLPEAEGRRVVGRGIRGDLARSRAPGGDGLGLTIVSRVAHAHGWGRPPASSPSSPGLC